MDGSDQTDNATPDTWTQVPAPDIFWQIRKLEIQQLELIHLNNILDFNLDDSIENLFNMIGWVLEVHDKTGILLGVNK
jgi:hypothetical protein